MISWIDQLVAEGILGEFDRYLVKTLHRLDPEAGPNVLLAAALVRMGITRGHVCLDLEATGSGGLFPALPESEAVKLPPARALIDELLACRIVGRPGSKTPLILEGSRLYLQRYWRYEDELACLLRAKAGEGERVVDGAILKNCLQQVLSADDPRFQQQREACVLILKKQLGIITGGPGTGKTTLVAHYLALLLLYAQANGENLPSILLVAPTGKAAARLSESLAEKKAALSLPDEILCAMPDKATTIHRALGYKFHTPALFRHNAKNPLPHDVIVVDEASMVDIALMAKMFDAVAPNATVILLGDKDQLSSVEAGSILGDICAAAQENLGEEEKGQSGERNILQDCVVELRGSHRFSPESGIGALAAAVNRGDVAATLALLRGGQDSTRLILLDEEGELAFLRLISEGYGCFLEAADPLTALERFSRFRILCAHRKGPGGVAAMNRLVEGLLAKEKKIFPAGPWYKGRPVMIMANNYGLRLFNGDTGIVWPAPDTGQMQAFFLAEDAKTVRALPLLQLPAHETAFAMTVHKSQGSEFEKVALVFPADDSPVLTRELLYTGITRAKKEVVIAGAEKEVAAAVERRVERASGLRGKLALL